MAKESWVSNTSSKDEIDSASSLTLRAIQSGSSKKFSLTAAIVALLTTAVTAAGRALIDDADSQAQCKTLGTWKVLGAGATAVSHTGNTSETALATVVIPANSMGPNGVIRVTATFSYTNSANNKTMKFRFGASGTGGTNMMSCVLTTTSGVMHQRVIHNRNATNSQVTSPSGNTSTFGGSSTALGTASIDTTAAQNIVITGQLANSGETITLESYLVEVLHAA